MTQLFSVTCGTMEYSTVVASNNAVDGFEVGVRSLQLDKTLAYTFCELKNADAMLMLP